ncbi:hypothetical protein QBC34DRAFT_10276 [Podospora aff. communis PSN243]|uniref:Life-span regulatory factor domain-containing protein n=1 Tax=Podospora aff. communis PSN243 TaxID=3040156 RepID=A0AAV9H987_9PEZI|nr:hypothetical protein QBC34DRAFT_10276 [Podospora aff. communis PSN243]
MHHQRRKSGHGSGNSSMTDVRKAVGASRPTTMTRRTTPQSAQKLGKNPRDREREWEEERWWDEERESFPQYCMICEKQFVPADDRFLYCSDACRVHDQTGAGGASVPNRYSSTHHASVYPLYSGAPEPRDIIPRASPSRPSSMHFSPPISPDTSHTSAISALKSLSVRPPSPSSPVGTYHSNIWPFGRSVATSPSTSYSRPVSGLFSSTYDGAYYSAGGYGTSSDRPLPSRRPGIYSRPKSIELVTPMVGR